jgi:flagellar motor protein MotB
MDKQEAKLRAQLQGTGVSVTRNGNDLILNMPGNITFKTASADLNSSFFKVLDSVGLVLKEFDKTLIDVEGHTDSDGSDQYNQQLSLERATRWAVPAIAWRERPAHRDLRRGRGPSDREQQHAGRQAAEPPRGAEAPAHHRG